MQNYCYFLGWDCSKDHLNYCLLDTQGKLIKQGQIVNTKKAVKSFFNRLLKNLDLEPVDLFCCIEHTGLYTYRLLNQANTCGVSIALEDPLRINKANQRKQDKTDEEDARAIAFYGLEKAYKLKLWQPQSQTMQSLKQLNRRRKILVKQRQALHTSHHHSKGFEETSLPVSIEQGIEEQLHQLKQLIKQIEQEMTKLILADEQLRHRYEIARSVVGLGEKNTLVIMIETEGFEKIATAKACANYAGLRPTRHQSGSSVKRKSRTSKKVNKALKTAFHHAAFSAKMHQEHFKHYYQRKAEQGKEHLQIMNAIRNKICRALYACIKNDVMYQKNLQVSLYV